MEKFVLIFMEILEFLVLLLSFVKKIITILKSVNKVKPKEFKGTIDKLTEFYVERNYIEDLKVRDKSGVILLHGLPGSGKSTLMAHFVKEYVYLYPRYFFGKGGGITIDDAKKNLYLMISEQTGIKCSTSDPYDSLFQNQFELKEKLIIVIDGLDEAEGNIMELFPKKDVGFSENLLFLVSAKTESTAYNKLMSSWMNITEVEVNTKSENTKDEITKYITKRTKKQNIDIDQNLKNSIIEKSEGNFLYVWFVLNAIIKDELPKGELPSNFKKLYSSVVDKILSDAPDTKKQLFEKIFAFYAIFYIPVSLNAIYTLIKFDEKNIELVCDIEDLWKDIAWLFEYYEDKGVKRYRLYHNTLKEFMLDYFKSKQIRDENYLYKAQEILFKYYNNPPNPCLKEIDNYLSKYLLEQFFEYTTLQNPDTSLLINVVENVISNELDGTTSFSSTEIIETRYISLLSLINTLSLNNINEINYKKLLIKTLNITKKTIQILLGVNLKFIERIINDIENEKYADALKKIYTIQNRKKRKLLISIWTLCIIRKEEIDCDLIKIPYKSIDSQKFVVIDSPLFIVNVFVNNSSKNYEKSIRKIKEIFEVVPLNNDKVRISIIISKYYEKLHDFNNSIVYLKKAELIAKELEEAKLVMEALLDMSLDYIMVDRKGNSTECIEKAEKIAREIKDQSTQTNALLEIIHAYLKLTIAKKGSKKNFSEYIEKAEKIAREIEDQSTQTNALLEVVRAYLELGIEKDTNKYFRKARKIAREIKEPGTQINAFMEIACAYIELDNEKKANEYLNKVDLLLKDNGNYWKESEKNNTQLEVIEVYLKLNEKEKTNEYIEKAESIAKVISGPLTRKDAFIKIIGACLELGFTKKADELISKIVSLKENNEFYGFIEKIYFDIIKLCLEYGEKHESIEYLNKAKGIAENIRDEHLKAEAYWNISNAYHTLKKMKVFSKYQEKVVAYVENQYRHKLCSGFLDLCKSYFNKNMKKEFSKFLDKAKQYFIDIDDSLHKDNTLYFLAKAYLELGIKVKSTKYINKTELILKKIECPYLKIEISLDRFHRFYELGLIKEAVECLKGLEALLKNVEINCIEKENQCLNLVNSYLEIGVKEKNAYFFKEAEFLRFNISNPFYQCNTFWEVARAYYELGLKKKGRDFLKKAKFRAKKIKDCIDRDDAFLEIAKVYLELAVKERSKEYIIDAISLVQNVKREKRLGGYIDDRYKFFIEIAHAYFELGFKEKGYQYIEKAEDIINRSIELWMGKETEFIKMVEFYVKLAKTENNAKYLEVALKYALRISDKCSEIDAFLYIASTYFELGFIEVTNNYIEGAPNLIKGSELEQTNCGFIKLVEFCTKLSKKQRTNEYLNKAIAFAEKIVNPTIRADAFLKILDAFFELNMSFTEIFSSKKQICINPRQIVENIFNQSNIPLVDSLNDRLILLDILISRRRCKKIIKYTVLSIKNDIIHVHVYSGSNIITRLIRILIKNMED